MLFFRLTTVLCLLVLVSTAPRNSYANESGFAWPIGCVPGVNCAGKHFRIGYPDVTSSGLSFACNKPGYIGHQGTDIVISSVEQQVPVLAAEEGIVRWTKDGLYDHCPDDSQKECDERRKSTLTLNGTTSGTLGFNAGNFIVLEHKMGGVRYLTLYAHLRSGSLQVKPGQKVLKGDQLAEVGSSGNAQIPHLHFGVYREQAGMYQPVDPWKGPCNPSSEGLWAASPPYRANELLLVTPNPESLDESQPYLQTIQRNSPRNPYF